MKRSEIRGTQSWIPLRSIQATQLQVNGPWLYALSDISYTPEVTTAETSQEEISQLAA